MTTQNLSKLDTQVTFLEEDIDFDALIEAGLANMNEAAIVHGKVTKIGKDFVTVDFGYKSEGQIPRAEFFDLEGNFVATLGEDVEIYIERFEDEDGQVVVSKEKAVKLRVWEDVGTVFDKEGTVSGIITARIKGGLSVDIGIKAFLPGSQVDLRPVRNLDKLIGERFDFKILKYNPKRGNIVLSRRAILEADRAEQRKKTLELLTEGALIKGHVKNITDYGIFVDLGGVDGLLHITDMTWGRIVHPSEMYAIGDEIEVLVLKFDEKEEKVSLGLKQKSKNPWDLVAERYPVGTEVEGKVVSLTNYGAFIEIEEGVEGLIHVSEMSWTKKVRQPSSVVNLGESISAVIKELDVENRRISLSMKEAMSNPWREVAESRPTGSIVTGTVRNITDFGVFVGLDEGIDGLVHVSDMSWSQRQRNPHDLYKKGDEIEVKILNIDVENQRLSLGIKQMEEDPWESIDEFFRDGDIVVGEVVHLADFGVFVEIKDGVEGLIHVQDMDKEVAKKSLGKFYPIGSHVEARVSSIKAAERRLALSITGLVSTEGAVTPVSELMDEAALKAHIEAYGPPPVKKVTIVESSDNEGENAAEGNEEA